MLPFMPLATRRRGASSGGGGGGTPPATGGIALSNLTIGEGWHAGKIVGELTAPTLTNPSFSMVAQSGQNLFELRNHRVFMRRPCIWTGQMVAPGAQPTLTVLASGAGGVTTSQTFTLTVVRDFAPTLARDFDMATARLWQDRDGTVPVTAGGQPVGRIACRLTGATATAPTDAARPAYVAPGTGVTAGLLFDGTDDCLQVDTPAVYSWLNAGWDAHESRHTWACVAKPTGTTASRTILSVADGTNRVLTWQVMGTADSHQMLARRPGGVLNYVDDPLGGAREGVARVLSFSHDGSTTPHLVGAVSGAHNRDPESDPRLISGATGAMSCDEMWIGREAASGGNYYKGTLGRVMLYRNTSLSGPAMEYEHWLVGQAAGITTTLTTDFYDIEAERDLWQSDDFATDRLNVPADYANPTQPWTSAYDDPGAPLNFGTAVAGTRTAYGSPGAFAGEQGWMLDASGPGMAAYATGVVANGFLTMTAIPTPPAIAGANVGNHPFITHARTTRGFWRGQFPALRAIMRLSRPEPGNFGALWTLGDGRRWTNAEFDVFEQQGNHGINRINCGLHVSPGLGEPQMASSPAAKTQVGFKQWVSAVDEDTHVYLGVVQPDGSMFRYVDGRNPVRMPRPDALRSVTVINPGTGLADGTHRINLDGGTSQAYFTITVAGGTITGVSIGKTGAGPWPVGGPVMTRAVGGGPIGGGAVVVPDVGPDGAESPEHGACMNAIINLGIGSQVAGTADPANPRPRTMEVYHFGWFTARLAAPARLTVGNDATFDGQAASAAQAVLDRYSALSSGGVSAGWQALVRSTVRRLMAWEVPPIGDLPGMTSTWDETVRTPWQARDLLYVLAAPPGCWGVNWKNPTGALMTAVGSPSIVPGAGVTFTGVAGQYLESGLALSTAPNVRLEQNGLDLWITAAPTNAALGTMFGWGNALRIAGKAGGFRARPSATTDGPAHTTQDRPIPTGHLAQTRGWKFNADVWANGEAFHHTYYGGGNTTAGTGTFRVGAHDPGVDGSGNPLAVAAGAAFGCGMVGAGRMMTQRECKVLTSIWADHMATAATL